MITRIVIKNYRTFREFSLDLHPQVNILVGDNDIGKSTLLEAVSVGLTGRLNGKLLVQELSPYLFNLAVTSEYFAKLRAGIRPKPPEVLIELYFENDPSLATLKGTNNTRSENVPGTSVRISFNPDFAKEYDTFATNPGDTKVIPTEYYKTDWLSFDGNALTARSVPAAAHLIDATSIRLQSGADYYLQGVIRDSLDPKERAELSRMYRGLREQFSDAESVVSINEKLAGASGDVTSRKLSLSIDISQRSSWESGLVPHLDDLPFAHVGKGEQSTLKILLALNRRLGDAHILLIEEPENHLTFSKMSRLVQKIATKCAGKQVLITTHSSYVSNKLGLDNLILLCKDYGISINDLPDDTVDYFRKLSGYDTLRIVLAEAAILVEGPSDELIVQRAYRDKYGKLPIEDGIDVINVRGLQAKRFLDIAKPLKRKVAVVTDNDRKEPASIAARFDSYTRDSDISVHVGRNTELNTLEPQLLAANGRELLNEVFGKGYMTDEELLAYMIDNKTTCALAVFNTELAVTMPGYIVDAVDAIK